MTDLFKHEAQTAGRDRSLTTAIIDRALDAGLSIRVQDAHGDNQTRETRTRADLIAAVGTSRETTFHILDMRRDLGKNVGKITVYHGGETDRIDRTEGRNDHGAEIIDSLTAAPQQAAEPQKDRQKLETVPTSALRKGDRILCNGCTMQLGEILESRAHKESQYGKTLWSRARVIERHDDTIPPAWLDRDPEGNRTWLVQGNDLATWRRYK